nr:hypothetical protein [Tanacetum cinerariifolium]
RGAAPGTGRAGNPHPAPAQPGLRPEPAALRRTFQHDRQPRPPGAGLPEDRRQLHPRHRPGEPQASVHRGYPTCRAQHRPAV